MRHLRNVLRLHDEDCVQAAMSLSKRRADFDLVELRGSAMKNCEGCRRAPSMRRHRFDESQIVTMPCLIAK
jgi:hypothetical protein